MIQLINLTKHYGKLAAVDELNLEVAAGEIFGFLGPNGAGKTTTIRGMMGILKPTSGQVLLDGYDMSATPRTPRRSPASFPTGRSSTRSSSGREFLHFVGKLYRIEQRG